MEHKHAADILIDLLKKPALTEEEKQAILIAIGVLAWTSLAQNKVKSFKKKSKRL